MPRPRFFPSSRVELVFAVLAAVFCHGWGAGVVCAQAPDGKLAAVGEATVRLDASWRFHAGDDPSWAAPGFDDRGWEPIVAGKSWEVQGHPGYVGYAWYRRSIALPSRPNLNLAIYISRVQDVAEVYWNGRLVGQIGKVPPHAVWYSPGSPSDGVIALGPAGSGVLAIRVWKAPYAYLSSFGEGGLVDAPRLASLEAAQLLRRNAELECVRSYTAQIFVALLAGLISLAAWIVWFRNRANALALWLALFTLRPLAFLWDDNPWISWRWSYGLTGIIYSSFDAALWFLLLYLLGLRSNERLYRWTVGLSVFSIGTQIFEGALQLFDWQAAPRFFLAADVVSTVPSLVTDVWGIVLVVAAARQRLDLPRWMLVLSAFSMCILEDFGSWVGLGQRWTHWQLSQYLHRPLFTVFGGSVDSTTFFATLVLVAVPLLAWRQTTEERRRVTALELEYQSAGEIQRALIPASVASVQGLEIESAYLPARHVGGDFFQVIPLAQGETLVVIGDVSGKGLGAAMAVAVIVGALNAIADQTTSPAALLTQLNRRLHGRMQGGFATCLALRIGPDGEGMAANAGHLSPYMGGREIELPPALPLGLVAEAEYEEAGFLLPPGERLTCLTDGVPEARNAHGELLGFERTASLSAKTAEEIARLAQAFGQEDDITVVTLARAI